MTQNLPESIDKSERIYVLLLAAIQIVHILDFVIMMPLGATFIRVFHISPVEFSSLVSAYTISAGLMSIIGAPYADRFDRKKFLLFNFTGFILGTLFCALSESFASLLMARIIAGAFGGILNACVLSFVSDLVPFHRRGAAMGIVMSAFSMASVAGVPMGLWIANIYDWHAAFYFICLLAGIFWGLSFLILPSIKPSATPKSFSKTLSEFKKLLSQRNYVQSFSLTGTLAFGIFMIIPFIGPYLVRNVGLKETQLPYIYLVGGIGTIITARIVGKLCDRIGCYKVFKTVVIISIFPILFLTNLKPIGLIGILIVTTLFTMFASTRLIPAMTLISGVVSPGERGTFMAVENSSRHLSSGLSSQLAGLIIGSSVTGTLTNFEIVGFICVFFSLISIAIARSLELRLKLTKL
jgi:predicted MFS family arabinose efflux permease